jgi:uncharacterized membrane protein YcaP (DUF421 family)
MESTFIAIRALGAIATLFILTRILGKKQISQLTLFEYITGIALGELAGFLSTDLERNYVHGIVAMLVWFTVPFTLEYVTLKNKTLRGWLEGTGRTLIKDGKVLEDHLKKERYSIDELMEQLRKKGAFNLANVEYAILEPSGEMNVQMKPEHRPLTPHVLGIRIKEQGVPLTVIEDGEVIDNHLVEAGLNHEWLYTELEKIGVKQENVFLAQVDVHGQLYVDLYNDGITVPVPHPRSILLAMLKKCQADLELFGLSSSSESARQMYTICAVKLDHVLKQIFPLLKE